MINVKIWIIYHAVLELIAVLEFVVLTRHDDQRPDHSPHQESFKEKDEDKSTQMLNVNQKLRNFKIDTV